MKWIFNKAPSHSSLYISLLLLLLCNIISSVCISCESTFRNLTSKLEDFILSDFLDMTYSVFTGHLFICCKGTRTLTPTSNTTFFTIQRHRSQQRNTFLGLTHGQRNRRTITHCGKSTQHSLTTPLHQHAT